MIRGRADGSLRSGALLDRSSDLDNLSWSTRRRVREFISEVSSLKSLRDCSAIYLPRQRTWNRCLHPLCWQCARHRANRLAADLRTRIDGYEALATVTLSLPSMRGVPLSHAWSDLDRVRDMFVGNRWLRSHVDAYRWHVEITSGPSGWHPHVTFLLANIGAATLAGGEAYVERWVSLASAAGFCANAAGQDFDHGQCAGSGLAEGGAEARVRAVPCA